MSAFDGYDLEQEQITAYKAMEKSNKEAHEKDKEKAEYEKTHTRDEFMALIGRNYLD